MPDSHGAVGNLIEMEKDSIFHGLFESNKYPTCIALAKCSQMIRFLSPTRRTKLISAQLDFNSIKIVSMKNLTRIFKVYLLLLMESWVWLEIPCEETEGKA